MRTQQSDYWHFLKRKVEERGGLFNAHLHLDRAGTYSITANSLSPKVQDSALGLREKHSIIPWVHQNCYEPKQLKSRVEPYLQQMVECGTRRADTVVDVTDDGIGLGALEAFQALKERYHAQLELRLGAYSPLGFKTSENRSWKLLEVAATRADFLGLLPERDERNDYPDHIGFDECCRRGLELAHRLDKDIHIHVDQLNHESEMASERVVNLVLELGLPRASAEPRIWLIHSISPSTYPEERFQDLVRKMASLRIGLICCPAAAISMRQLRPILSPTYNSIARVLDFLAAGVWVRLGSDNVCDITSPMGTVDLFDELLVLGNAMRFYDPDILSTLAVGADLSEMQRNRVRQHLDADKALVEAELERAIRISTRV